MRGTFLTFEGPEGGGKSTHASALAEHLRREGVDVLGTREPGGTRTGEAIRGILQHDHAGEPPAPETEMLLFAACRAQLVRQVIEPALAAGRWVICDRFGDSTMAYQGYGRGLDRTRIEQLNALATGGLQPDMTLLLDVPVEEGLGRVRARRGAQAGLDRMEREGLEFHRRVRDGYLELARREPGRFRLVDATGPVEAVTETIWSAVRPLLGARAARKA